jgi:hypothetical protein
MTEHLLQKQTTVDALNSEIGALQLRLESVLQVLRLEPKLHSFNRLTSLSLSLSLTRLLSLCVLLWSSNNVRIHNWLVDLLVVQQQQQQALRQVIDAT